MPKPPAHDRTTSAVYRYDIIIGDFLVSRSKRLHTVNRPHVPPRADGADRKAELVVAGIRVQYRRHGGPSRPSLFLDSKTWMPARADMPNRKHP